jgi:hypothetical protein
MKVWLVEAEHWEVPGRRLEAHASLEGAKIAARDIVNLMLNELGLTLEGDWDKWKKAFQRIPKRYRGDNGAYVTITEMEFKQ